MFNKKYILIFLLVIIILIGFTISIAQWGFQRKTFEGRKCVVTADDQCSYWGYQYTDSGPAWVLWNTSGERWERIIPNLDADTFQIIKGVFAKDKNRVYLQGHEIIGANPASFEIINQHAWLSRDERSAFAGTSEILGARPGTIRALSGSNYSTDGQNIYSGNTPLIGADVKTFEARGRTGRDMFRCYIASEIKSCDEEPFISWK